MPKGCSTANRTGQMSTPTTGNPRWPTARAVGCAPYPPQVAARNIAPAL